MRILYITPDTGGCMLYRCALPGLELLNAGHTVKLAPNYALTKQGQILGAELVDGNQLHWDDDFDVVVIQRCMGEDTPRDVARARAYGQVVINDVDDWFWGLPQSNRAFATTHPSNSPTMNREHYRRSLQASSAITASTPYLAERIREFVDCPVYVLRNALDPSSWRPQPVVEWDTFTIGWVGAIGYRSPRDLHELSGVVGGFLAGDPGRRFVHIGAETSADTAEVASVLGIHNRDRVESRHMCPVHELPDAMRGVDVFLAPLEASSFNHAKSAIKAQEASAAGVPFIASDMPEYRWFSDGRAGVICDKPSQWRAALERLTDVEERRKLSRIGRERVEEVSIGNTWKHWERTYEECLR